MDKKGKGREIREEKGRIRGKEGEGKRSGEYGQERVG